MTEPSSDAPEVPSPAAPRAAAEVAGPTAQPERIIAIDVLRGFALLGILVMNIPYFALTNTIWFDPRIAGGFEGADYAVWLGSYLFFEMKMMSIFSLLFGAGIAIFTDRLERRTGRSGRLFYRRMLWLLVIGLMHGYLLWEGDILVMYAVCGMLVYLLRKCSVRALVIISIPWLLVGVLANTGQGFMFEAMRDAAVEAQAALDAGETLSRRQEETIEAWADIERDFYPNEESLALEREAYTGDYLGLLQFRAPDVVFFQTWILLSFGIWRAGGLMILGMAALRAGIVSAERSNRFYLGMLAIGYGAGLPIVYLGSRSLHAHEFDAIWFFKTDMNVNYIGSLFVAAGHVALVMLACRADVVRWLQKALAAVGQMALSNYILQSLICTTLFFGYGFNLFAREFSRSDLMLIVLAIWAFQLLISPLWLRHYRFGPLEWLWRSLTYGRAQPMRRQPV